MTRTRKMMRRAITTAITDVIETGSGGEEFSFNFGGQNMWNFATGAEHHGLVFRWDT